MIRQRLLIIFLVAASFAAGWHLGPAVSHHDEGDQQKVAYLCGYLRALRALDPVAGAPSESVGCREIEKQIGSMEGLGTLNVQYADKWKGESDSKLFERLQREFLENTLREILTPETPATTTPQVKP